MQSMEVIHLVQAYRTHELRWRAEKERRMRRLLAKSGVAMGRARTIAMWLQAALSLVSRHTTSENVLRSGATLRSRRGAA